MTAPIRSRRGVVLGAALLNLLLWAPRNTRAQQATAVPGSAESRSYTLTLGDAARLAAQRNASVQQAQSRVQAAQARVRESTADLLPSLDGAATRGAHTLNSASFGLDFQIPGQPAFFDPNGQVIGPVQSADVRASLSVPLLDFAALGRRRSAQSDVDAARMSERAVAEGAAAAGAHAYLAALRARAEVEAREKDLELAQELLTVAQGTVDAGVGVALDVTRAQAQIATVRAQLLAARHRAEVSELALRRALRLSPDTKVELTSTLDADAGPAPNEEAAVAGALEGRKDLAAAEAYRDAASQSLSAVRADRLPTLSLAGDEGYYGKRFGHMLNTYSWGLRVSVPIFDGFKRSAQMQEERARLHEIDFGLEDMRAEVSFQVRQALLTLSSAREQVDAAAERLRLAQLEVDQEEDRIRAGVSGTADVVRAAMRLNEARTAQLDVLAALQAARVSLASAMGTVTELP